MGASGAQVILMVEFKSETRRSVQPFTLMVTVAVLVAAAAVVFFYARHQRQSQPVQSAGPVIIPGMLRPGETNFEYYKNKIRIENVKASLGITFNQTRVAFVSGIIGNEGDRKLEALELKITLYDVYDKLSKERIATPLRPGLGLNNRPMEPLEKRTFSVGIESIEQLWNPKRLEIEITGLKYQ
jgi:hypothetical protein